MSHSKIACLVAASLVLAVAVCSIAVGSSTAAPRAGTALPKTITIGVLATLTGPIAFAGLQAKDGIDLAVKEINAKGGIRGSKLKAVYLDDGLNPSKTVQNAQELLSRDGANVIFGATTSTTTLAAETVVTQANVLHLLTTAASDSLINPVKYPYSFRGFLINSRCYGSAVASWVKAKQLSSVAIVARADEFGREQTDAIKAYLAKMSPQTKIVTEQTIPVNGADISPQLLAVKAANPQAILAAIYHNDGVSLLNAAAKIGYLDSLPPTIVLEAWAKEYWDSGAPVWKTLTVMTRNWILPLKGKAKTFDAFAAKTFGKNRSQTDAGLAAGYDNVYLLKQAIEATNSVDGGVLKAYLERGVKSLYRGVTATVAFSPTNHDPVGAGFCEVGKIGKTFEQATYAPAIPPKIVPKKK